MVSKDANELVYGQYHHQHQSGGGAGQETQSYIYHPEPLLPVSSSSSVSTSAFSNGQLFLTRLSQTIFNWTFFLFPLFNYKLVNRHGWGAWAERIVHDATKLR